MVTATAQATHKPVEQTSILNPITDRIWHAGKVADTIVNRSYSLGMSVLTGAASLGTLGSWEWVNDKREDYWNDATGYGNLGLHVTGIISPGNAEAIVKGESRAEEEAASKVEEAKKKETEKAAAEKAKADKDDALPTFSPLEAIEKASGWIAGAVGGAWNYGGCYADQGKLKRDVLLDAAKLEQQLIDDLAPLVQGHKQVDGVQIWMLDQVKVAAKAYRDEAIKDAIRRFNRLADSAAGLEKPIQYIEGKRAQLMEEIKKEYLKQMRPAIESYLHAVQRVILENFFKAWCRSKKQDANPPDLLRVWWLDQTKSLLQGFKKSTNTVKQDVDEVYGFYRLWDDNIIKLNTPNLSPTHWTTYIAKLAGGYEDVTAKANNRQGNIKTAYEHLSDFFSRRNEDFKDWLGAAATRLREGAGGESKTVLEEAVGQAPVAVPPVAPAVPAAPGGQAAPAAPAVPAVAVAQGKLDGWLNTIAANKDLPGIKAAQDKILGDLSAALVSSNENETECVVAAIKAIKALAETESVIPKQEPDLLQPVYNTINAISTLCVGNFVTEWAGGVLKSGVDYIAPPFIAVAGWTATQTLAKIIKWCVSADAIKDVKDIPGNTKLMMTEWGWGVSRKTGQVLASSLFAFSGLCTAKILGSVVGGWIPGLDIANILMPNDFNGLCWASLTLGAYYQLPKMRKYVLYGGAAAYGIQYYTPWGMPNPINAAWSAAGWGMTLTSMSVRFVWHMPAFLKAGVIYTVLGSLAYQKAKSIYKTTRKAVWDDTVIGKVLPAYRWGNKAFKWVKKKAAA